MITDKYRWLEVETGLGQDKLAYIRDACNQCDDVYEAYLKAYHSDVDWVPAEVDAFMEAWLNGNKTGVQILEDFRVLYIQGHPENPSPAPTPTPGESGVVCKRPGGFFMHGDGDKRGAYKKDGAAQYLSWNGSEFITIKSAPVESYYHTLRDMVTTECPGNVYKNWVDVLPDISPASLAFEILETASGLVLYTMDNVNSDDITLFKSTDGGNTWFKWKQFHDPNHTLLNACTDGVNVFMMGHSNQIPIVIDINGNDVIRLNEYSKQQISYAVVKDGLWTLGIQCIEPYTPEGDKRNSWLMYHNGKNGAVAKDLDCPWTMDMKVGPDGWRYAIASVWNETGYPNAQLAVSKTGRGPETWTIHSIPLPTVIDIELVEGGVMCHGGQYGEYGATYFQKIGA